MATRPARYLVDEEGKRIAVVVEIAEYEQLLDALEELGAIRAYDAAKAEGDDFLPLEQALVETDQQRA